MANNKTAQEIAKKALDATVFLEMKNRNDKRLGFGSGFFVQPNRLVTNHHVIAGAARGTAKQVDKTTTYNIEGFTVLDEKHDLAILQVLDLEITPLPLGNSNAVKIGETVYVAGNPKGLEGTFSDGIISAIRPEGNNLMRGKVLQMTAPISPGSSGGPVLNHNGEVIGVSFMTIEGGQNLNFAIPSNYIKELLARSKSVKPFWQGNQAISAEAYFLWGNTKYDLGQYKAAIIDYDKAICLKPDYAKAYNNRGLAKDKLGQHLDSIADCNRAIHLKPDFAAAYNNRGLAKGNLGQYKTAIADYKTAIQLKPNYAEAYNNRGLAKGRLGQHFPAITDYDMAIRFRWDFAEAYNNRGTAKYRLEQYFDAITDYDTAIQLKPDCADAYNNRGIAKNNLEQYFDAIADYDTAIRLQPNDALTHHNRGFAKAELGHTWAAKQDLRTALKLAEHSGDEKLKTDIESMLQGLV